MTFPQLLSRIAVLILMATAGSLGAFHAHAAVLELTSPGAAKDTVTIQVLLDPEDTSINTISGGVSFDADALMLTKVDVTDSPVNVWLTSPHLERPGVISWSGVIPGGFTGVRSPVYSGSKPGLLFTLTFSPKKTAETKIIPFELEAHANDGKGTLVPLTTSPLSFSISKNERTPSIPKENISQPVFLPTDSDWAHIYRSPLVAGNKWYLATAPETESIAIDHIDIAESSVSNSEAVSGSEWKTIRGPYVLTDQKRLSYVYVRFVTLSGQSYIATLPPAFDRDFIRFGPSYLWGGFGIVVLMLLGWLFHKKKMYA